VVIFIALAQNVFCQALSTYILSFPVGTYTPITGTIPSKSFSGSIGRGPWDDASCNNIPIGFNFIYADNLYNTISANVNGWIVFGQSISSSQTNTSYANDLSNAVGNDQPRPILAPFWDDLFVASNPLQYRTAGPVGSRTFTLQWTEMDFYGRCPGGCTIDTPSISFQIILYEGSNTIDFVYQRLSTFSSSAAIGITGDTGLAVTTIVPFWSLQNAGPTPAASMVADSESINMLPATNQIYRWTPPPCTFTANATNSSPVCEGDTLHLTGTTSSGVVSYSWRGPAGFTSTLQNPVITGITAANAGTYTLTATDGTCPAAGTTNVVVTPRPASITGPTAVCAGATSQLNDAITGGTWISNNTAVASIDISLGTITSISAGITTITYSVIGGCSTTTTFTVNPLPAAIANGSAVCLGSTVSLSDGMAGGTWGSSNSAVATVGASSGIVSGVSEGSVTITYSVLGCITTTTLQINGPQVPQICVVSLDSATGKNLVVWEQFALNRVARFNIYRENSSSVFVKIDSQAANVFSTYLDTGSYPIIQSFSYQLTATDSCGNESLLGASAIHSTVHLSASLGVGSAVDLIWNTYVGKSVTTQNIMRSVGGAPFVNIASVANTVTSYTDIAPPSGTLVYKINSVTVGGCSPAARTTGYATVSSNPVEIGAIELYPNPAHSSLTITSSENIKNITISNIVGQIVYTRNYNAHIISVDLSALADGVYFVKINGSKIRKFVKE
jgi:hypothetical protein